MDREAILVRRAERGLWRRPLRQVRARKVNETYARAYEAGLVQEGKGAEAHTGESVSCLDASTARI